MSNNIRPFTYEETKLLMDMMRGVEIKPYSPAEKPKPKISYGKKGNRKSIEVKR